MLQPETLKYALIFYLEARGWITNKNNKVSSLHAALYKLSQQAKSKWQPLGLKNKANTEVPKLQTAVP